MKTENLSMDILEAFVDELEKFILIEETPIYLCDTVVQRFVKKIDVVSAKFYWENTPDTVAKLKSIDLYMRDGYTPAVITVNDRASLRKVYRFITGEEIEDDLL